MGKKNRETEEERKRRLCEITYVGARKRQSVEKGRVNV